MGIDQKEPEMGGVQTRSKAGVCPFSSQRTCAGHAALLRAYTYAQDTGVVDVWDFALQFEELYRYGLTVSDLRWLIAKDHARQGVEISVPDDAHRSFERRDGSNFVPKTCMVLTEEGAAFAAHTLMIELAECQSSPVPQFGSPNGAPISVFPALESSATINDFIALEASLAKPHPRTAH